MTEHEDSIFNAQDDNGRENPLNKTEAEGELRQLLQEIDADLTDEEKQELEPIMAKFGEMWFADD